MKNLLAASLPAMAQEKVTVAETSQSPDITTQYCKPVR